MGPSWAVLDPAGAVLDPSWDDLWNLLGRFGPFLARKGENPKNLQKPMKQSMIFAFGGPLRKPLGGLLGRLGAPLDRLEAILGHLGRFLDGLGVSWSALGLSWSPLGSLSSFHGPSWAPLVSLWGRHGPKKPPTWPREGVLEPGPARERKERFRGASPRVPMPAPSALGSLGGKRFVRHPELCLGALALGSFWRDLLLLGIMVLRAFHVTVRCWEPW